MFQDSLSPPLLTADLPGIGGQIKSTPEDFEVEEVPAYQPSGSGDFLYLWVEKRGMGGDYFARQVARRLGIAAGEVGMAGLKDRHAVTRQMISIPGHLESQLPHLEGDGIRVLSVSRHGNKLKTGHLHGNRFRILVRTLEPGLDAAKLLPALLERIRQLGLPNFYGPQRFGHDGETLQIGFALLGKKQDESSGSLRKVRSPFLRKLALSAAQAGLFNLYLARRLNDGLLRRVLDGDVMSKWPYGGMFVALDTQREQERFDARETVSTGPIFGRKTFPAAGAEAEREASVLADAGLSRDSFHGFGKLVQGTRRHNLVYMDDLAASIEAEGVRLTFTLPAGSYATVLLREVMKTAASEAAEES